MKILVIGGGMVGNGVVEELREAGHDVRFVTHKLYTQQDVSEVVTPGFDWVVNAAGKTGKPNVDWCEDHKEETYESNVHLPMLIQHAASSIGAQMLHISSGCIFAGGEDTPFTEEDEPNFSGSFYSFTKRLAEKEISKKDNVLTARLRIPLIGGKSPRGIIAKLMGYDSIIETPNSVSYMPDFYRALRVLMENGQTGIWNIVNPEPITYRRLFDLFDSVNSTKIAATKTFIDPRELKVKAQRSNCVLSTEKIQDFMTKHDKPLIDTESAVKLAAIAYAQDN